MISLQVLKAQLSKSNIKLNMWGRGELRELCKVMTETETCVHAVNGWYEGGFALLCATDQRLILVDRKPMFLTLDTISYWMIQEISLNYRLFNSTLLIYTSNKVLMFSSINHYRMREILNYSQQQILESRLQYSYTSRPSIPSLPSAPTPITDFSQIGQAAIYNSPQPANFPFPTNRITQRVLPGQRFSKRYL